MPKPNYRRLKFQSLLVTILLMPLAIFFDDGRPPLGGEWSVTGVLITLAIVGLGVTLMLYGLQIGEQTRHRYYGILYTQPGQITYFKIVWMVAGAIIALMAVVMSTLAMSS